MLTRHLSSCSLHCDQHQQGGVNTHLVLKPLYFGDVWTSSDGADWTVATHEAPWGERTTFSVVSCWPWCAMFPRTYTPSVRTLAHSHTHLRHSTTRCGCWVAAPPAARHTMTCGAQAMAATGRQRHYTPSGRLDSTTQPVCSRAACGLLVAMATAAPHHKTRASMTCGHRVTASFGS